MTAIPMTNNRIQKLPTGVVNKIAAGEVIERPASVLKELLENAIDSGAQRIDVAIEKGGSDLVRVSDDGSGIAEDQLPLAVASHATSKIRDADDLFQIKTLGFRGEALASIAEVSRFTIRSRTDRGSAGAELEVHGGQVAAVKPCGCPQGTTIEVRHLFFNTPVRRKFLRTTQTEMGHVLEAFTRIALAHHSVHMTLQHNGRPVHDLPPVERWLERIRSFYGGELGDSLIWLESQDEQAQISGYVADPSCSRGNNRMQYLLLNGRFIRDRSLQHALTEAYRGLLLSGRYPIVFLRLEIPPESVDVNVHPAKMEVRFADGRRLYSQLLGTLRNKFLTTDLTARARLDAPAPATNPASFGQARQHAQKHRQQTVQWARGEASAGDAHLPRQAPAAPFGRTTSDQIASTQGPADRALTPEFRPFEVDSPLLAPSRSASEPSLPGASTTDQANPPPVPAATPANAGLQIHNRYLVAESEEGLVIIDQHALHERILYEQLRTRVLAGPLESQRLLVPEPVSLTASEVGAILDAQDLLGQLGIEVESFGGDTVLVSSYPAMLANFRPDEVLRQMLEQLAESGRSPDRRDLIDDLLHMIACKAAIKAGDRLSAAEISALLEQRYHFNDAHHCPHGRPTALLFSNAELDKRFKRT